VGSSITAKTNIFVAGVGAKVEAAIAKGIEIWDETKFVSAISNTSTEISASSSSAAAAAAATVEPKKPATKTKAVETTVVNEIEQPKKKTKKEKLTESVVESKSDEDVKPSISMSSVTVVAPPSPAPSKPSGAILTTPGGSVKPDRTLPDSNSYTVYADYSTKLMQTNIGGNNNKFYIIQVLEKNGKYYAYNRWGRLG
jgi:hypothetical protein